MQEQTSTQDLKDRLALIESMMTEGRRTTESWGWVFVLWGVAYYVAILWTALGQSTLAWPVTMISACVLTGVLVSIRSGNHPNTNLGRSIGSIWIAAGISMFLLFLSLGTSGRIDQHIMVAVVGAMLGTANAASSMILKWKMQFACAVVWWAVTVFACFGKGKQLTIAFLAAIFFCQIVFGIYGMIAESRVRKMRGTAHA
ncbi:hypothetical protein P8935_23680 [Telmatobacter sp. DSM 110680]|uniref:Acid-resistance membrane protein n=1 Tax=Telmatobacter sp. DSM 110680 TaxID=3036704 RepID=A0AAU7DI83_9BACT